MRESERINYDEQLSSTPSTNASPNKLLAEAYQQNNGNKDCSVDPYGSMKYDSKDGSLTLPPKCPESPVDKLIGLPALTGSDSTKIPEGVKELNSEPSAATLADELIKNHGFGKTPGERSKSDFGYALLHSLEEGNSAKTLIDDVNASLKDKHSDLRLDGTFHHGSSYKDSDDGKTRQFAEEHGAFIVFDNNTKAVDALGINAKTVVVSENSKFDYMDGQFLTF